MDWNLYLAFVVATSLLMAMPGPNVALIVGTSVAHGARAGLVTVAGTSSGMVVQLALTALGLGTALAVLADAFTWLRWCGVAYLCFLGVAMWRAAPVAPVPADPTTTSARAIYARGFLVSLTNPKTLLFYGAFFPQFLSVHAPLGRQLALLSGTFLMLALTIDGAWALAAGRARGWLSTRGRLKNRLGGGLLIGAALGLALARRR